MDGMVDIGGLSLHIHCIGEGVPIVVLDSGLGLTGEAWDDVQPEVGRFTRVCAYDRAGRGYSSPAPKPHPNRQMARELAVLLERAGQRGPYVLVAHSMAGMNARLFASEHPDRVAGMVLVDAVGDGQPSRYWGLMPDASIVELRGILDKLPEGLDFDTWVAGFADMRDSSRQCPGRSFQHALILAGRARAEASRRIQNLGVQNAHRRYSSCLCRGDSSWVFCWS
jgi:pimeloyl-ACP methyl ester carboxylesterase